MIQKKPEPKSSKTTPVAPKKPKGRFETILNLLKKQRKAILVEAGLLVEDDLTSGKETPSDLGDRASAEIEKEYSLRLRERDRNLLKKVEEAIDRIKTDTFGICEACGGAISVKRLKARPVTTLCIACKTAQEAEEKIKQ